MELPEREPLPKVMERVDEEIDSVLMGHDFTFNHSKISYISLALQRSGVKFFGTNPDKFTTVEGKRQPSNGSMMACLEQCSGNYAEFIGKPNPFVLNTLIEENQLKKEECIMIGDNMNTDMKFARNGGIDSLCVLTGNTKEEEARHSTLPTYYAQYLS